MKSDYLFVIDLDGTLLPRSKKIPNSTVKYIRKLVKEEYKIVLASGRPAKNIMSYYNVLHLNTPIISLNGIHLHFPGNTNKDERIFFNNDAILQITNEISKNYEIENVICETDKDIYITNKDSWLEPNFWLTNMRVHCNTLKENLKNKVMTLIVKLKSNKFSEENIKKIFNNFPHLSVRFWQGPYHGFLEIYEDTNNKYLAVKKIARHLNVNEENIYAFGDDINDLEMLENIKHSYAMCNGCEQAKKLAKNITKIDNQHQGIKAELEIILKNLK